MSYGRTFLPPPMADDPTLEQDRGRSTTDFITAWNVAGRTAYEERLRTSLAEVERLFAATNDLLDFADGAALAGDPSLLRAARFVGGPPVSEANLNNLAGANVATRRRLDPQLGQQAARVIGAAIDRERLAWLFWTAGLMAEQGQATALRGGSSARQEAAVEALRLRLGFTRIAARAIDVTGGLGAGQFCRETHVVGIKCDIPIGLRDGRYLFLECKVSNSGTNSVKRLNRECGGKAAAWWEAFGARAITGAVLAGVFKLKNLRDAQEVNKLAIFWEHDLGPLQSFVEDAV